MKTSKTQVLLDKYQWLRKIIDGTPWYFKAVLRYIAFATLEPGDEAKITPRNYTFTIEHSGEQIKHGTWVHVFYKGVNNRFNLHPDAWDLYRVSVGQTLAEALKYLRGQGKIVDAIVVQTKVHSSKIGTLSDTFDVVIPKGSSIENDKLPRLISERNTVAEVGIGETAWVQSEALRDGGTTIDPAAPTARAWKYDTYNVEIKRFDDHWCELPNSGVRMPKTVYLRA